MQKGELQIILMGANGRMGKTISHLVEDEKGIRIAAGVERPEYADHLKNLSFPVVSSLEQAMQMAPGSVIVDFTSARASMEAARLAASRDMPIVIGSTGMDEKQREELATLAKKSPVFCSANMSIGINVLAAILPELVRALGSDYDIEMVEIHHKHKKDAPSGTALLLGEVMAEARGWHLPEVRNSSRDGITGERKANEMGIMALRGGDVPGVHEIFFMGPGEIIEITHRAESRENFARGALRAARWMQDRQAGRLYSMRDVLFSGENDKML